MNRDELVSVIKACVEEWALSVTGKVLEHVEETSWLLGTDGLLDSLGLVSVILDVEQEIADRLGVHVTIADERAMSQKRSPFRTVGSLADYTMTLVQEQQGA